MKKKDYKFNNKLKQYWDREKISCKSKKVLIAFSGGADSVCLTLIVKDMGETKDITLIYFDHQLRPKEVEKEKSFLNEFTKTHHLKSLIKTINVKDYAQTNKLSIETSARKLRYKSLIKIAEENNIDDILTAHHLDDQCETVIHRLSRGSRQAFNGIKPITFIDNETRIIRPLLVAEKSEILHYLKNKGSHFMTDSSNQNVDYTRNYIRHKILPHFEHLNPNYRAQIGDLCEYFSLFNDFCQHQLETHSNRLDTPHEQISLLELRDLHPFLQQHYIYTWIKRKMNTILDRHSDKMLTSKHIDSVIKLIQKTETGISYLPQGLCVKRVKDHLVLSALEEKKKTAFYYDVTSLKEPVFVKEIQCIIHFIVMDNRERNYHSTLNSCYLEYDEYEPQSLIIRTRRAGDIFCPYGMQGRKSLKKFFIDKKIPRDERDKLPLFFIQNQLAWIKGFQISEKFKIKSKTKKIMKIKIEHV